MYLALMKEVIGKTHAALFGIPIHIITTTRAYETREFGPCAYIHTASSEGRDPEIVRRIHANWDLEEYVVIYDNILTQIVYSAIKDRPHMKPLTIIWSLVTKVIWDKIRVKCFVADPQLHCGVSILTPEHIAYCLPTEFELDDQYNDMTVVQVIESIYEQELEGFRVKLASTNHHGQSGFLSQLVERSVLSYVVALLCKNDAERLLFLKSCCDLVLNTKGDHSRN